MGYIPFKLVYSFGSEVVQANKGMKLMIPDQVEILTTVEHKYICQRASMKEEKPKAKQDVSGGLPLNAGNEVWVL